MAVSVFLQTYMFIIQVLDYVTHCPVQSRLCYSLSCTVRSGIILLPTLEQDHATPLLPNYVTLKFFFLNIEAWQLAFTGDRESSVDFVTLVCRRSLINFQSTELACIRYMNTLFTFFF